MADGELAAAIQELTNRKLAKAIEELREKYDRIDAEKEAAAARGEGVRVGEEKAEEEEGRQKRREEGEGEEEEDDSDDEFLNDPELEALRAARLAQMKRTVAKRQEQRQLGHGEYRCGKNGGTIVEYLRSFTWWCGCDCLAGRLCRTNSCRK